MNEDTKRYLYDICVNHRDVLIVDVMNYLHRYYWTHQDLSVVIDDKVVQTGHLYGFTKFLLFLKDKFHDCSIVLAMDGMDKTRREINSEYKAGRSSSDNLYNSAENLFKMCSVLSNVYTCYDKDYEADDIINSVSNRIRDLCKRNNINKHIYILSNDKDMFQLVRDDNVSDIRIIRKFGTGKTWYSCADIVDEKKVEDTFEGVSPYDVLKFRAITGDPSDNLKGYYRFRKKDAAIIANNFDYNLENNELVLKKDVHPGYSWRRFLPKITENMMLFKCNYEIMRLRTVDFELELLQKKYDYSEALSLINRYELVTYMNAIESGNYSK